MVDRYLRHPHRAGLLAHALVSYRMVQRPPIHPPLEATAVRRRWSLPAAVPFDVIIAVLRLYPFNNKFANNQITIWHFLTCRVPAVIRTDLDEYALSRQRDWARIVIRLLGESNIGLECKRSMLQKLFCHMGEDIIRGQVQFMCADWKGKGSTQALDTMQLLFDPSFLSWLLGAAIVGDDW